MMALSCPIDQSLSAASFSDYLQAITGVVPVKEAQSSLGGNICKTSDRRGYANTGLSEHVDTFLSLTDLVCTEPSVYLVRFPWFVVFLNEKPF